MVYFSSFQFDAFTRCFQFNVEQEIELKDPKPAYVKVYDYYETGQYEMLWNGAIWNMYVLWNRSI